MHRVLLRTMNALEAPCARIPGTEVANAPISGGKIWLRVSADIRPGEERTGNFSYSTDGVTFKSIGPSFVLNNEWMFFMGYRYGIFNYATQSLGGGRECFVLHDDFAIATCSVPPSSYRRQSVTMCSGVILGCISFTVSNN